MKNTISKLLEYSYYFSLVILFILYLFPGSIIGYLLYGDLGTQPNLIKNPIGTSINHFLYFLFLAFLGSIFNSNKKKFINSFFFLLTLSIILELLHIIIPIRTFEYEDLIGNILGVILVIIAYKIKVKYV